MSHTRYASVIFTLFLLSILSLNVAQVNAVGDYWAQRKSAPISTFLSAGAVVRGQVYVVGGLDAVANLSINGRPIPSNVVYDPSNDSWKTLAPMPTVRQQLGAVAINDRIYTVGGDNRQGILNVVEVYDPMNNAWTSVKPLPVATTASAISVAGSTIYVIGGINSTVNSRGSNGSFTTAVWAFDTVHNVWTRESNMPTPLPVGDSAAITIGDRIYVAPKSPEQPNAPSLVYNIT